MFGVQRQIRHGITYTIQQGKWVCLQQPITHREKYYSSDMYKGHVILLETAQTVWGPLKPETTFPFCSEDSGMPLEVLKLQIRYQRESRLVGE